MRYDRTPHVRLYKLKDKQFYRIGWEGRTVLWHLRLEADLLGRVEIEDDDPVAIADQIDVSVVVLREALPDLLAEDLVRWETFEKAIPRLPEEADIAKTSARCLRIVDFEVSETAHRSAWLCSLEHRQRRILSGKAIRRLRGKRGIAKAPFVAQHITAEEAREQGLITRTRAAEIMGVSLATLRRREGVSLRPLKTELGEHVFREDEVRAAAIKDLTPRPGQRAPRSEQSGDPIWRERAARLLEHMAEGQQYSTAELAVLAKRCGIKDTVVADLLAAADGVELQKVDGKWSAAKGAKP